MLQGNCEVESGALDNKPQFMSIICVSNLLGSQLPVPALKSVFLLACGVALNLLAIQYLDREAKRG